MSLENSLDDVVTGFLLKSCQLRPQRTVEAVVTALKHGLLEGRKANEDPEHTIILTSGSVAEFYIEPMLPLFGDIDVMFHFNTQLAIPRGHPPPTQLPAEFHKSQLYPGS